MTNAALVAAGEMLAYALSGYYFFRGGEPTIGEAYMMGSYMGLLFGQIADIRWQVNDLQHAEAGIGRIQQLSRPALAVGRWHRRPAAGGGARGGLRGRLLGL